MNDEAVQTITFELQISKDKRRAIADLSGKNSVKALENQK